MDAHTAGVGAFPLVLVAPGERVRIAGVSGGDGIRQKLADMGLAIGSVISVANRQDAAGLVIARDDVRIAVGFGVAYRILVARLSEDGR
jgi:Fe2+ transport system protein FeoA